METIESHADEDHHQMSHFGVLVVVVAGRHFLSAKSAIAAVADSVERQQTPAPDFGLCVCVCVLPCALFQCCELMWYFNCAEKQTG